MTVFMLIAQAWGAPEAVQDDWQADWLVQGVGKVTDLYYDASSDSVIVSEFDATGGLRRVDSDGQVSTIVDDAGNFWSAVVHDGQIHAIYYPYDTEAWTDHGPAQLIVVDETTGTFEALAELETYGPLASGPDGDLYMLAYTGIQRWNGASFDEVLAGDFNTYDFDIDEEGRFYAFEQAGFGYNAVRLKENGQGSWLGTYEDPRGIRALPDGSVVIADQGEARLVYHLDADGQELSVREAYEPSAVAARPDGSWLVYDRGWGTLSAHDADGNSTTLLQTLAEPKDVAVGPDGLLYATSYYGTIFRIDPTTGSFERFVHLEEGNVELDFDAHGNLWVANYYRGGVSVSPDGAVEYVYDPGHMGFMGMAITPDRRIYMSNHVDGTIYELTPGEGPDVFALMEYDKEHDREGCSRLSGLSVDPDGALVASARTCDDINGLHRMVEHPYGLDPAFRMEHFADLSYHGVLFHTFCPDGAALTTHSPDFGSLGLMSADGTVETFATGMGNGWSGLEYDENTDRIYVTGDRGIIVLEQRPETTDAKGCGCATGRSPVGGLLVFCAGLLGLVRRR